MEMVALLVRRATRSHITDGPSSAARMPLLGCPRPRTHTGLLVLSSQVQTQEEVKSWKLQITEKKNVPSLAQTEFYLPRMVPAPELKGSCVN